MAIEALTAASAREPMRLRAYRVCLDATPTQITMMAQSAGAQRWAFNWALARKIAAHKALIGARHQLAIERGLDPDDRDVLRGLTREATQLVPRIPSAIDNLAAWRQACRDDAELTPWRSGVSSYCFSSGMRAADAAFKNWLDSRSGRRAGGKVGYPRFKSKHRARASFTIYHDVKKPTIRVQDARHLLVPRLGVVRLHSNLRRLIRLQRHGDVTVRSITISRQGRRWFASVLVEEPAPTRGPSRAQMQAGVVGVDVGVKHLLVTSDGMHLPNDRLGRRLADKLTQAQQAFARTQRGSQRRAKAARRIGDLQARLAERRSQRLHQVTKHLATRYAAIAIEDLNVAGMTRSARGTIEQPGRNVRAKAGLNREILDVAFGEFARQLAYKTGWYGARLALTGRFEPTSKTCSACGSIDPTLTLAQRTYQCAACGHVQDRDHNAAINIAALGAAQINSEAPDGVQLQVARSKPPGRTSVLSELPDTRDKRDSRGDISGRRPRTGRQASPALRDDPGRPRVTARGHPDGVIRQRSKHTRSA